MERERPSHQNRTKLQKTSRNNGYEEHTDAAATELEIEEKDDEERGEPEEGKKEQRESARKAERKTNMKLSNGKEAKVR